MYPILENDFWISKEFLPKLVVFKVIEKHNNKILVCTPDFNIFSADLLKESDFRKMYVPFTYLYIFKNINI